MNSKIIFLVFIFCPLVMMAQQPSAMETFHLSSVRLLDSPFKQAELTDLKYIMEMDMDRLLAPYLREAGLTPKGENYPNWENTGLDGHIGGHYVTALSLMYASTGNEEVLKRLNYMLDELKRCQDKHGNGYLGGVPGSAAIWSEVAKGEIDAGSFNLNKKWVPLYNIHKMYAGLRDACLYAGNMQAKEMLIRFSDWMINVTTNLDDKQMQVMLQSEHGGLNEVFADVYGITGDEKYINLARRFSHQAILVPLSKEVDKLNNLHANTQIPKVIGFKRIAELTGDSVYKTAAGFFWENVTQERTVAIGGNSVREHFHPADDFSSMITSEQGPETCNTYNMLKLTKMLYQDQGQEKYIDYYERALYNHILSSQHPDKGGFVYFTPMRPGHYRVYSQPQTSFWCCVGSGLENHAKYGELIYAHKNNDLYVNLFIPSQLTWKEKGIVISQQTSFPDDEKILLKVEEAKRVKLTLNIRYPLWVAPGALNISVNGKAVKVGSTPGSYTSIKRIWKKGDVIEVTVPMKTTTRQMPDGSDYVVVLHGPIVLAAKTDTSDLAGLWADDSRMSHVARGNQVPLQDMPLFVSNSADISSKIKAVPDKPLTFTASELIYPGKNKNLELIPFFRVHDSRYIIYWQLVTPDKLIAMQKKLAEAEVEKQKLEANTIDVVFAGEQQPESDHFIESENSYTGVTNNRHWRAAKGWFSYKFTDTDNLAGKIHVTYSPADKNREFIVLINNEPVSEIVLFDGPDFCLKEYSIPDSLLDKPGGLFIVKFVANEGSVTGNISEVRLLKE